MCMQCIQCTQLLASTKLAIVVQAQLVRYVHQNRLLSIVETFCLSGIYKHKMQARVARPSYS